MTERPTEETEDQAPDTNVDEKVAEAPTPFEDKKDGVTKKFKIDQRVTMGEMHDPIVQALGTEVEMVATAQDFLAEINEDNPITLYVHGDKDFDDSVIEEVLDKIKKGEPQGPEPDDGGDTPTEPAAPAEPPSEVVVTPATDDTELPAVLDKLEAGDTLTTKELSQVLKNIVRKGDKEK